MNIFFFDVKKLLLILTSIFIFEPISYAASKDKPFANIVFFGDSLNDPGNLFHILSYDINWALFDKEGLKPIELISAHPFFNHRVFTNGHVLSDQVAQLLGLPYTRGAFSNSRPDLKTINEEEKNHQSLLAPLAARVGSAYDAIYTKREKELAEQLLYSLFTPSKPEPDKPKDAQHKGLTGLTSANLEVAKQFRLPPPVPEANNFAIANANAAEIPPGKCKSIEDALLFAVFNPMSLKHQVDAFASQEANTSALLNNTAFVVMIGANDLFLAINRNDEEFIDLATQAIEEQLTRLLSKYPINYLLIANEPDLGSIPTYNKASADIQKRATNFTTQFNSQLLSIYNTLKNKYRGRNIGFLDNFTKFNQYLADSKRKGLNTTDACISDIGSGYVHISVSKSNEIILGTQYAPGCTDDVMREKYVFFDHVHPEATKTDAYFALQCYQALINLKQGAGAG